MTDDFDTSKRFVRLIEKREDGFIEFEFAVGEPEIFAEMMLAEEDFIKFCQDQEVVMIDENSNPIDHDSGFGWRLRDAAHKRI